MKKLILFLTAIIGLSAQSQSSSRPQKIDAIEFFETLVHPDLKYPSNKRNPRWPDQLTLEPVELSDEDFLQKAEGIFQVVYHCNGRPVMSQDNYFDGKGSSGYLEITYDGKNFTQYKITPEGKEFSRITQYTLNPTSAGTFKMKYQEHTNIMFFVKIKETHQIGLVTTGLSTTGLCSDSSNVQLLELRKSDIPTM